MDIAATAAAANGTTTTIANKGGARGEEVLK